MLFKLFTVLNAILMATTVYSFDTFKLHNNKEVISKFVGDKDASMSLNALQLQNQTIDLNKETLSKILDKSFQEFQKNDSLCDLGFIKSLAKQTNNYFESNPENLKHVLVLLRHHNLIDDLFLKLNQDALKLSMHFDNIDLHHSNPLSVRAIVIKSEKKALRERYDLNGLFSDFKSWPNETTTCSVLDFKKIRNKVKNLGDGLLEKELKRVIRLAYKENVIDKKTYIKLEFLREQKNLDNKFNLESYLEKIENSKDLIKVTELELATKQDNYLNRYISRRNKLTRRADLYNRYNSTQIVMLSSILEKTAKRMDASSAFITFDFDDQNQGEEEILVLSPMEQYRLSLKMLRKDMAELMKSINFESDSVSYQDVIAAAIETGAVSYPELKHIIEFEEFWNPTNPKWKTYARFIFGIAGSASIYLPPPYNFIGAIALIFTQIKVFNSKPKADPANNWNVVI
jgi:hypothetical protein